MLRLTNLKMERVHSSSVGCTCEGGQSSLLQPSYSGPQHHHHHHHLQFLAPTPHSLMSSSATGQKLLQVKHESRGGGAEKKLGVCWRENSRGHELPAVVFKAELLPWSKECQKINLGLAHTHTFPTFSSGVVSFDASFMNRSAMLLFVHVYRSKTTFQHVFIQVSTIWPSLIHK